MFFDPNTYTIAITLLPRLLGLIYFFVFGALLLQMKGLFGKQGILPIEYYLGIIKKRLGKRSFYYLPSLYWLNASDAMLIGSMAFGAGLSILLLFGVFPVLLLSILFILHLSIISAGQEFLSFGWETFFLEITFNTLFLSISFPPNPLIWISLNLVLFRFHFQAGVSKLLSYDVNWRNFLGIYYHYQSQPIPNAAAWYIHKWPLWFHKFSCALMFFIELVIPFGMLGGEVMHLIVFFCFIGLQLAIYLTGNFSYLNHLTAVLCIILVSDTYFPASFENWLTPPTYSLTFDLMAWVVGALLITLQLASLWNYFWPNAKIQNILRWIQPFHIVNRYGIFAVMTTTRYEIVVEGSEDQVTWKEYAFPHKPSELNRRLRRISPYQPRLDWQAWFLPFDYFESEIWFQNFLYRLLEGSPPVLKLLQHNPFPQHPPKYIRAVTYVYEFTDTATKRSTGAWWKRSYIGSYSPILTLNEKQPY